MNALILKLCRRCNCSKSHDMFHKNKNYKDGLSYYCKQCNSKVAAEARRKKHSGCSREHYDKLMLQQKGRCAICGKTEKINGKGLAADHCHYSLKVRGLLCHNCNVGLGYFNDDIELLKKAIKYLRKTK